MSQTGFTPISNYSSATASAVPLAANLVQGELAINTNDGKLFYKDSSGVVQTMASKATGAIGGSTTQVQFNSSGALAGSANLTFNGTTLTAAGLAGPLNGTVGATTPAAGSFTSFSATSAAVNSDTVTTNTAAQTLTNKAVQARVVLIADATSITVNADTTDVATQANTQAVGTLTVNAPTGTLVNGQKFILRLRSTNVQTFSWNAVFQGSTDIALPTASSGGGLYDYVGFIYNSTSAKWQMIAKVFGF